MATGLKVKFNWYQIGGADFLYSFFSTVACNIENNAWGSRFPVCMHDLHLGEVLFDKLTFVEDELETIKKELEKLPVDKLVWDREDLTKLPPWGTNISPDIKNLSDYFVTSGGENLLDVFFAAIHKAKELKANLEIKEM